MGHRGSPRGPSSPTPWLRAASHIPTSSPRAVPAAADWAAGRHVTSASQSASASQDSGPGSRAVLFGRQTSAKWTVPLAGMATCSVQSFPGLLREVLELRGQGETEARDSHAAKVLT